MNNLPTARIQHIDAYDSTYKDKFGKVSKKMTAHCFIHNCHKCFKPWSNCYCYCKVCKTYFKYCHQLCHDEMSTYEGDSAIIIPFGF